MKPILVFNHTLHRELWDWMIRNKCTDKSEWPGWYEHGIDIRYASQHFLCFACMTADNYEYYRNNGNPCRNCPLDWGTEIKCHYTNEYETYFNEEPGYIEAMEWIRDRPIVEPNDTCLIVL